MKLSTLIERETSEKLVYGVEVDEDVLTPPEGLTQVGLLYKGDENGIDDLLVDAIIAFSLAGVEVIVEVSPTDSVDPKDLLTISGNAGFSIALLPPKEEKDLQDWKQQCANWASAYLQVPNFTGHLYPVSGYFGYLTAKAGTGIDAAMPNDAYTSERFVDATPQNWSDQAKEEMHKSFCDVAGGKEEFDTLLKALIEGILNTNLEILKMEHEASQPPQ